MRDAENIREVEALGIDLIGFIFWSKSSRYVSEKPDYLPTKCKRVGVFVDEDIEVVKKIAQDYALDYIQLHGNETPDYCALLKGHKLIKAFNIATAEDFEQTKPYEGLVKYFLFDTKGKSVGGNGTKFDWSVLDDYHGTTPFILSGGIGPDDAARIRSFHHPQLAGIDLNSKFEDAPALKNIQKLKTFLEQL
jgi:phosphoribosylanthranilate isomerase